MNHKIWGVLIIAVLALFPACLQQGPACNKPYILVGNDCCLDKNGNNICDKYEATLPTTVPETTTSVTVPETTVPTTIPETTVPETTVPTTTPVTVPETTVPVTIPETTISSRQRRYMSLSISGNQVNRQVTILVKDKETGDPIEDVDIDVYLDGVKIFSSLTDDYGKVRFTPTESGTYTITADKSRYRDEELGWVVAGVPETTVPVTTVPITVPETTVL